jgi:alkanesulfonate monooxygenase SsuD/methylene tetrahydromethanopterin reductase-like flavin-dependent oxidoreductase (luciferase family)
MDRPRLAFGYNPPTGNRKIERVDPATFRADLDHVLRVAAPAFDSVWISDHLMTEDRFRLECWTELTWIAARFPEPLLGTIVLANSYRHPALLAKMAASLQYLSGGRFILGYGAGWMEDEYRAYGFDFPSARTRIEQMVEGIDVIRALWTGGPVDYAGDHYRLTEAMAVPVPDPLPPIMIGGDGERVTLRAVATHADWWNAVSRPMDALRRKIDILDEHCSTVGRDPSSIVRTITFVAFLDTDGAAARRAAGPRLVGDEVAFAGEPGAMVDHLAALAELGFEHVQLVFPRFPDTSDIELFLERVRPEFGTPLDRAST